MKIKINLDAFGQEMEELVRSGLEKLGLPECLGEMIPPTLKRVAEFESTDVLEPKNAVLVDDVVVDDLTQVVINHKKLGKGHVISKKGEQFINQYKQKRMEIYTSQLKKCASCEYRDVCYKLTRNYLRAIGLEEKL